MKNEAENWLSMSEAAGHTPYSAEYLSLLARKKKLSSKKIGNAWYTTKPVLDDYMKKQMIRAQVQNGNFQSLEPLRSYEGDLNKHKVEIVENTTQPKTEPIPVVQKIENLHQDLTRTLQNVIENKFPQHLPVKPLSLRIIFSNWIIIAAGIILLIMMTLLPVPIVFGFLNKSFDAVKEAVQDSNTVLGFRPGTHENEILLLDGEGNIAIMGHVETGGQLKSFVADGVAPIVVDSRTLVQNLNAELLGGASSTDFTLAFVTANGSMTTEDVQLEGNVEVGKTLLVRGATKLLGTLEVGQNLKVFGEAEFRQALNVFGPAYFESLVTVQNDMVVAGNLDVRKNISLRGSLEAGSSIIARSGSFLYSSVSGDFSAGGEITLGNPEDVLTIDSENVSINAAGDAIFDGSLNASSLSITSLSVVNSTTTNATTTNLTVSGDLLTSLTLGSVPFIGTDGLLTQNNDDLFWDDTNSRLGIGTSTPESTLSLVQTVNGANIFNARRITDVAPSGDFIEYLNAAGDTTLFRVDNSGNLLAGGIINTGAQTITSISQPQFRVQYDASNEWTASTNSAGISTFGFNGTTPRAIWMPGSDRTDSFQFQNAAGTPVLSIDTTNERVGIGTTSPQSKLDVYGTTTISGIGPTLMLEGGSTRPVIRWTPASGSLGLSFRSNDTEVARMQDNGHFFAGRFSTNAGTNVGDFFVQRGGTDGGMSFPGSSTVTFGSGTVSGSVFANEYARFISGGNFGVGSTTPWGRLSASSTSDYPALAIEQKGAGAAATFLGGNIGIGTSTPSSLLHLVSPEATDLILGMTLDDGDDVNDYWKIQALHSSNNRFKITNGTTDYLSATPGTGITIGATGNGQLISTGAAIDFNSPSNNNPTAVTFNANTQTGASGTVEPFKFTATFAPTTGTGNLRFFSINETINQTGTATGDYTALFVNVTETAATGVNKLLADFRVGDVSRAVLTSSGNLGIGTTSPFAKLSIAGAAGGTTNLFAISTSTAGFATTTALTVDENGNLSLLNGAGLTVSGATSFTATTTFPLAKGNFLVGDDSGNAQATSSIFISSIGNVGIGTTVPEAGHRLTVDDGYLSINDAEPGSGLLRLGAISGAPGIFASHASLPLTIAGGVGGLLLSNSQVFITSLTTGLRLSGNDPDNTIYQNSGGLGITTGSGNIKLGAGGANFISLTTNATERLRVTSDGNVGIGTTTPTHALTVSSPNRVTNFGAGVVTQLGIFSNDAAAIDKGGQIVLGGNSGASFDPYAFGTIAGRKENGVVGSSGQGGYLQFSTTNSGSTISEHMRITSTGNVGIGNISPSHKLDVAGDINIDQYSKYYQSATPIMFATSTHSFFAGQNAGLLFNLTGSKTGTTGIGSEALSNASSTGTMVGNTAIGYQALRNTLAGQNTAIGYLSLQNNYSGVNNVAIGYNSLSANVTGGSIVAIGAGALAANLSADIVAIGSGALDSNTTGTLNTGVGYHAVSDSVTTSNNTGIGHDALRYTTGGTNTAVGSAAGRGPTSGTVSYTGGTSIGWSAGVALTTGASNSFFGGRAGEDFSTGGKNVMLGYAAGDGMTIGSQNLMIGYNTTAPVLTGSGQLNLGHIIFGTGMNSDGSDVDTDARIGVGSTTPFARLTVQNIAAVPSFIVEDGAGDTSPFIIDASGNVGIGMTNPAAKFDINGITLFRNGSSADNVENGTQMRFGFNGTDTFQHYITTRHNSGTGLKNAFDFYTSDGTSAGVFPTDAIHGMTITNGSVGIGTTSPWGKLSVTQIGTDGAPSFIVEDSASSDGTPFIIDQTGNVGIGTSSPDTKLQVIGNIRFGGSSGDAYPGITTQMVLFGTSGFGLGYNSTSQMAGIKTANNNEQVGFHIGSSEFGLYTNATQRLNVDRTTGAFRFATGTPTTPILSFLTDTNTGIYSSGADTLGLVTGGTERLTVTSTGNIGIGTTSPFAKLSVVGGTSGTVIGADAITGFTGNLLDLKVASTTKFSVNQNGDLLSSSGQVTGTKFTATDSAATSSLYSLTLKSTSGAGNRWGLLFGGSGGSTDGNYGNITADPSSSAGLRISRLDTGPIDFGINDNTGFPNQTFTSQMRLTSAGNVGIGTTTPVGKLHITGSTGNATGLVVDETPGGTSGYLILARDKDFNQLFRVQDDGNVGIGTTSPQDMLHIEGTQPELRFVDTDAASNPWHIGVTAGDFKITETDVSNWLTVLKTSGNVGIGTPLPNSALNVSYSNTATTYTADGGRGLEIINTDTTVNNLAELAFRTSDAGGALGSGASIAAVFTSHNESGITSDLAFTTNPSTGEVLTEKMRITSDGNVGIGTVLPVSHLDITSSDGTGGVPGGTLTISRSDTGLAASDPIGKIQFWNNDTQLTTQNIFGDIEVIASNLSHNTDAASGDMVFRTTGTTVGGSPVQRLKIGYDGIVTVAGDTVASGVLTVGAPGGNQATPAAGDILAGDNTGFMQFDASSNDLYLEQDTANQTPARLIFSKSRGTAATPVIADDNDGILHILGRAYDGSDFSSAVGIRSEVVGTPTTGIVRGELFFQTSNSSGVLATRLMINSDGNVGISDATPTEATLTVGGDVHIATLSNLGSTGRVLCADASGASIVFVNSTSAENCTVSSARFKHDITDINLGLDTVRELRPVSFTFNGTNEESLGFIAEEVDLIDRRLVAYDDENRPHTVNYSLISAVLTRAVQELDERVTGIWDDTLARMSDWGVTITQSFTRVGNLFAGTLHIENQLCVDDVCISKEQLKALLVQAGGQVYALSEEPIEEPIIETVAEEPTTATTSEEIITEEPIIEESPTATSSPEILIGDNESTIIEPAATSSEEVITPTFTEGEVGAPTESVGVEEPIVEELPAEEVTEEAVIDSEPEVETESVAE